MIRPTTAATLILGFALSLRAEPAPPAGATTPDDRIPALVKQLGADDAATRDRATKDLESLGEPARAALQDAAKSDDPEVAWRARTILDHLDNRPGPDAAGGGTRALPRAGGGGGGGSSLRSFNFRIDPGSGNSSVVITQDGSGRVTVTVTETEGGKRVTKSYEAESPDAFKQQHPDIAKKYGIGDAGGVPRILHDLMPRGGVAGRAGNGEPDGLDPFDPDWARGFHEDFERLHEQMQREMDELFRQQDPMRQRRFRRFLHPAPDGGAGAPDGDKGAEERADRGASDRPETAPPKSAPGTLGIRIAEVDPALRGRLKLGADEGVLVEEVLPGTRAEKAGVQRHDVIVKVNGTPVQGVWALRRVLREAAAKDEDGTLDVAVIRGGSPQTLKVRVAGE